MTVFRILLSIALFIAAIVALVGLFLNGFSWLYVAVAVIGFLLAAWVWPSDPASRRRSRRDRLNPVDLIELLIESGAELVLLPLRLIGWLLRHGGVDVSF